MTEIIQADATANQALAELAELGGLDPEALRAVTITGAAPVLPLPYHVDALAAAALAATGAAANEIWRLRCGRRQQVRVDMPAAAISSRSDKYLTVDGARPPWDWEKVSGFYPVRDGRRIFLHANFPNLRDRALAVLGAPQDPKIVAEATAGWDGEALETAIHDHGGCASFVRTHAEWAQHPHRTAIKFLPVFELVRLGDAPPQRLPSAPRPLSGIRVLDLTRVIAGPIAARTLAEHGADVLKITRRDLPDSGALDIDTGLGKLAADLDFRQPAQDGALRDLVREADVFVQSYRPGALAAHGYGPEQLAALRPGIVCVSLSAWSHAGPWQLRRGFDTVVQSATGMAHHTGDAAQPRLLPVSAIDHISGRLLAYGAMLALARRAQEGGSWLVRASLATTGRWVVDRGLLDPASLPDDLPAPTIAALRREIAAPIGKVSYLAPPVMMSDTPPGWDRPPVPLGSCPARWP